MNKTYAQPKCQIELLLYAKYGSHNQKSQLQTPKSTSWTSRTNLQLSQEQGMSTCRQLSSTMPNLQSHRNIRQQSDQLHRSMRTRIQNAIEQPHQVLQKEKVWDGNWAFKVHLEAQRWKWTVIAWEMIATASPYKCGTRHCNLCLTEKLLIMKAAPNSLLNSRNEIVSKCRHSNKFKLGKL